MSKSYERISFLRKKMEEESLDAIMVNTFINWQYLTGFTGDSGSVLITGDDAIIFTDSRYTEQAEKESPGFTVIKTGRDDVFKETLSRLGVKRLGFEKDRVTYSAWERMKDRFADVELTGYSGWVEEIRAVKTGEEIELISRAQEIADEAFELVTRLVRIGVSEIDLALELEFTMRKLGAESLSFPIIAVSGERSSLPHGSPTRKEIADGDFLTLDFGARYQGYCSDETRTFIVGNPSDKHLEVYKVVLEAQLNALDKVAPGIQAKEVDLAGRKVIEDAGYGEYFGHAIGHGVGLNVHERPGVGSRSENILEPGMVITVEPGIYIPGFGGVRIEDLVLVTESGKRILSSSPKDLTAMSIK